MGCIGYKWEWNIEKFEKIFIESYLPFFYIKVFHRIKLGGWGSILKCKH